MTSQFKEIKEKNQILINIDYANRERIYSELDTQFWKHPWPSEP